MKIGYSAFTILLWTTFFYAGCNRSLPPKPEAEFIRDAAVKTKVRAFLAAEPALRNETIEVVVDGETILLRGTVRYPKQKEKATEAAVLAGGGASVKNELVVQG